MIVWSVGPGANGDGEISCVLALIGGGSAEVDLEPVHEACAKATAVLRGERTGNNS